MPTADNFRARSDQTYKMVCGGKSFEFEVDKYGQIYFTGAMGFEKWKKLKRRQPAPVPHFINTPRTVDGNGKPNYSPSNGR